MSYKGQSGFLRRNADILVLWMNRRLCRRFGLSEKFRSMSRTFFGCKSIVLARCLILLNKSFFYLEIQLRDKEIISKNNRTSSRMITDFPFGFGRHFLSAKVVTFSKTAADRSAWGAMVNPGVAGSSTNEATTGSTIT